MPILISQLGNQTTKEWKSKLSIDLSNDMIPKVNDHVEFLTSQLLKIETILERRVEPSQIAHTKRVLHPLATTTAKLSPCPSCNKNRFYITTNSLLN